MDDELTGSFKYNVDISNKPLAVSGTILLQKKVLFTFDEKMRSSNIAVSKDGLAAWNRDSSSSKAIIYGTIGFSSGVHYWEFKVDKADCGSVYVGVSEKHCTPGLQDTRINRWSGYGYINRRASFRGGANRGSSDSVQVYGDHFDSGDTVGVLLDMNRGRISFFLDGMKFGDDHNIQDLGEAFDGLLSSSGRTRPRTFYPVVGLARREDRFAITPRWVSNIGADQRTVIETVRRAWSLMYRWGFDRPTNAPLPRDLWIYRAGWRELFRWQSGKYVQVRTRCSAPFAGMALDVSPVSCVRASIKLGLPYALFAGDKIRFTKSCGVALVHKEDAVILGAYRDLLWYKFDYGSSAESSSLTWCLAVYDIDCLRLLTRSEDRPLPPEVVNIRLARIPLFHGGFTRIVWKDGAVMRSGIEIDKSAEVHKLLLHDVVYSVERRSNSSNVMRYRVFYKGMFGWTSERMRGNSEDVMMTPIDQSEVAESVVSSTLAEVRAAAAGSDDEWLHAMIHADNVDSVRTAVRMWIENVRDLESTGIHLPEKGMTNDESNLSFDEYVQLSSTVDGVRPWTVEADMQLTELITRTSLREGVSPVNLPFRLMHQALLTNDDLSSPVLGVDPKRLLARASLLRAANQVIGLALPYTSYSLPEERLLYDCSGSSGDVDCLTTQSAAIGGFEVEDGETGNDLQNDRSTAGRSGLEISPIKPFGWSPPCVARRMRSLRRLLFGSTKLLFWESILEATTTSTPPADDQYEDPRDIKTIKINRVKSTQADLSSIPNILQRLKQSVLGQLHRELHEFQNASYRRSFIGKGHGGQKRAFKVNFLGEGVNDYGGPYRELFEQIVGELQCDKLPPAQRIADKCLLPILIPCPNRVQSYNSNLDKFVLCPPSSAHVIPTMQEHVYFLGKLIGTAVRHNMNLSLDLCSLLWRPLVRLPVSRAHLETIDTYTVNFLKDVERVGSMYLSDPERKNLPLDFQPPEWAEAGLVFTTILSDGTRVPLVCGGEDMPVNLGNWRKFVSSVEFCRLMESSAMYKIIREGLACVLPVELLPMFTSMELEQLVTGSTKVDLKILKQCTEYEDISPDAPVIQWLWEVLQEMTDEERTLFLRFVWARSRMPSSAQDLPMNFKIQSFKSDTPNEHLPHAQTCFFSLSLPSYSSKEILKSKLLYAINNSPNMDADVRLHNAEGWNDS